MANKLQREKQLKRTKFYEEANEINVDCWPLLVLREEGGFAAEVFAQTPSLSLSDLGGRIERQPAKWLVDDDGHRKVRPTWHPKRATPVHYTERRLPNPPTCQSL